MTRSGLRTPTPGTDRYAPNGRFSQPIFAGLPALARIIDELAPDAVAIAIAEVPDRRHVDYLPKRDNVQLVTSVGTGNGQTEEAGPGPAGGRTRSDDGVGLLLAGR